jgi:bifunctional non-homologous end joining protein LigD
VHPTDEDRDGAPGTLPPFIAPMKGVLGDLPRPAEQAAWSYEVKWDGMRVIACVDGRRAQLWSANHIDVTRRFPDLAGVGPAMGRRAAVLDGEVVAFDAAGLPSFATLQARMHVDDPVEARRRAAAIPLLYAVFDVLHFDGHEVTGLSFERRVQLLDDLFDDEPNWRRVDRFDDGPALLAAVIARGLEGVMAKRRDSPYTPGRRSSTWRKVKVRQHAEFVVGGWLPGTGARAGRLGALLVGYHDDGALR